MPPTQPVLDLLERSLIHGKADGEHEEHLAKLTSIINEAGGWSKCGNFDVDFEKIPIYYRQQLESGTLIGSKGGSGVVKRIVLRDVPLAQKSLASNFQQEIDLIKRETSIGKKVDGHKHIVKLVGTYHSTSTFNNFRHILTFPVAVCDLEQFLDDFEVLRRPSIPSKAYTLGRQCEITVRLLALGFSSSMPPNDIPKAINRRLLEISGCITKAVKWIHSQDVQHRDLKPHNILLRPGQVYITDFGISRAAENGTTQSYSGHSAGYSAPEVLEQDEINPAQADIYSLGCIFLHFLTMSHSHVDRNSCSEVLRSYPRSRHGKIVAYIDDHLKLRRERSERGGVKLTSSLRQRFSREVKLTSSLEQRFSREFILALLADDRKQRPVIDAVDMWLYMNGGAMQRYHGECCRRPTPDSSFAPRQIVVKGPVTSRHNHSAP